MRFILDVAFVVLLIIIGAIDFKQRQINIRLLIALLVISAAAVYATEQLSLLSSLWAMGFMFSLLSIIYLISRKAIGWGDVLLCTCTASYLGVWRAVYMLAAAMLCSGLCALLLIIISRQNKGRELPFAPFVLMGVLVVLSL